MRYEELLQRNEWIKKSAEIIQRDAFKCQKCGSIGFHSMSIYICKDFQDLDGVFDRWSFNGLSFSTFIEKEKASSSNYEKCIESSVKSIYVSENGENLSVNDYTFFRLSSVCTARVYDDVDRTAYCCCKKAPAPQDILYSRRFRDGTANCVGKGLIIKNSDDEQLYLKWGNTHILNHDITDAPIVSIEYVYPIGVVGDNYGVSLYGGIVISVTYKNFVGSFYFHREQMKGLNVHHKYYVRGKAPWEYEDDALITLCKDCHRKEHQLKIPVYRSIHSTRIVEGYAVTCNRCGGAGYLPQYEHVEDGVCFKCWGEGAVLDTLT